MKKILLILVVFLCYSCSYTTINSIGSVTAYTANGDVLQKWDNVKLNDSFKAFGVNFYDTKSGNFIILNNATPCIIEYKTKETSYYPTDDTFLYVDFEEQTKNKNELIEKFYNLVNEEITIKNKLKNMSVDSDEYYSTKEMLKHIKKERKYILNKLFREYNWHPQEEQFNF